MRSRLRATRAATGGIIAAGLLACGSLAGTALAPARAEFTAPSIIRIVGNHRIEAASIRSYLNPGHGEHLDAADLDVALKALYATRLFADVRITRSGDELIVTVVENRILNRVAFEGNRKLKDEQFKGEVQSKSGGTLWHPIVQQDVARIAEIYRRRGYFAARIEPKIIERPNQQADLVFEIQEGGKTGVKKIQFVGNRAYSSDQLKATIRTGE